MILSASGWRTVFALSGNEEDGGERISAEKQSIAVLAGTAFARYMIDKKGKENRSCLHAVGSLFSKVALCNEPSIANLQSSQL